MALDNSIQAEIDRETPVNETHDWFDFIMSTEVDGQEIPK